MREMTVEDVIKRVAEIRAKAGDDEVAHGMEDQLHQDVLREIAAGNTQAAALAREALRTEEIEFCR